MIDTIHKIYICHFCGPRTITDNFYLAEKVSILDEMSNKVQIFLRPYIAEKREIGYINKLISAYIFLIKTKVSNVIEILKVFNNLEKI